MGADKLSLHLGECLVFDENIGHFPSDTTHCALVNVKSICPTTVEQNIQSLWEQINFHSTWESALCLMRISGASHQTQHTVHW